MFFSHSTAGHNLDSFSTSASLSQPSPYSPNPIPGATRTLALSIIWMENRKTLNDYRILKF